MRESALELRYPRLQRQEPESHRDWNCLAADSGRVAASGMGEKREKERRAVTPEFRVQSAPKEVEKRRAAGVSAASVRLGGRR